MVGAYRLLAPIGEGGMGVVHLAQGPDGRRVALKVLRPHIVGDTEARERLAREVSSLKRISSPRIAEILDSDPHGPVPFVVTRYVPGLSLYHHVAEEGPITGADLLHFADALAEALQAVHAVGVLHRDVKPTNVLMEGRSPVLIDFGLARVAEDPRLTQTGWLLGTPGYLAPEILYGDEATVASDVHAWAATVAFAATGRPPYGTGPTMAILDRVRRGQHELSGVPDALRRILRESLDPEPLERPSLVELRAWLTRLRQQAHLAAPAPVEPDLWTLPYAPQAVADHATPATDRLVPQTDRWERPTDRLVPLGESDVDDEPTTRIPVPGPPVPVHPAPVAVPASTPAWREPVGEAVEHPEDEQYDDEDVVPWIVQPPRENKGLRVLQLLGLGVLTGSLVAAAPYSGVALVTVLVLLLRTVSVTRQRHGRRQLLRGRPRWYDVPTTTLSSPGYLVLASFGTVGLVVGAAFVGVAMFSLAYLLREPVTTGMLMAGAGFVPTLWWGPGSGRVREVTRGAVRITARSQAVAWLVVAACLLGSAVLLGMLGQGGPSWAPAVGPPWR